MSVVGTCGGPLGSCPRGTGTFVIGVRDRVLLSCPGGLDDGGPGRACYDTDFCPDGTGDGGGVGYV